MNFNHLRVHSLQRESADSVSISVTIPHMLRDAYRHTAGQYVLLRVPHPDGVLDRAYSICHAPDGGNTLTVTVKRVAGGRGSNWLVDALQVGDEIAVSPPMGRFVLPDPVPRRIILIAGGSGITPIRALAEAALQNPGTHIRLLSANRTAADRIFRTELTALRIRHPERMNLLWHDDDESGYPDAGLIRTLQDGWEDATGYVCGPAPLMDLTEADWLQSGPLLQERFGAVSGGAIGQAGTAHVTLGGETRSITVNAGETILAAAQRHGLKAPHDCKQGYCGACKARVAGDTAMRQNIALTDADLANGQRLTCQTVLTGPEVTVTYDAPPKPLWRDGFSIAALAGLAISAILALWLFIAPDHQQMLNPGPMTTGHAELSCVSCHEPAAGTMRQNLQAAVMFRLGQRQTDGHMFSQPVGSDDCTACHARPNDRHPITRFTEPRFVDALDTVDARTCAGCHTEHTGERASADAGVCIACHQGLTVKDDPLDRSHADLIAAKDWGTCMGCHDFHGNHKAEVPVRLNDRIPEQTIRAYLADGPDPYADLKTYLAKDERP